MQCNAHEVRYSRATSNQVLLASMSEWAVQYPDGRIFHFHACLMQGRVHKQPPLYMTERDYTGQGRGEQGFIIASQADSLELIIVSF